MGRDLVWYICRSRNPTIYRAAPSALHVNVIGGVATFLGDPDHSVCPDCHVLHDSRTGAGHREGKVVADILRAAARPAGLRAGGTDAVSVRLRSNIRPQRSERIF